MDEHKPPEDDPLAAILAGVGTDDDQEPEEYDFTAHIEQQFAFDLEELSEPSQDDHASNDGDRPEVNLDGVPLDASLDQAGLIVLRGRRHKDDFEVFEDDDFEDDDFEDDDEDEDDDDEDLDDDDLDDDDDEASQEPPEDKNKPLERPIPIPVTYRPLSASQKLERLPGEHQVAHHLRERVVESLWEMSAAYQDYLVWSAPSERLGFTEWMLTLHQLGVRVERREGRIVYLHCDEYRAK